MKAVTYIKPMTQASQKPIYLVDISAYGAASGISLHIPSLNFHMFCLIKLNVNIRMAMSSPLRIMFSELGL